MYLDKLKKELDKLDFKLSSEEDPEKRMRLFWESEKIRVELSKTKKTT